ncbi:MFS transporter [Bacillus gobiensis]|uniref:MFS transporter n=1 Tax=Bacillus gobiensis TaxID=1441095 RepID=UPI003D1B37C0
MELNASAEPQAQASVMTRQSWIALLSLAICTFSLGTTEFVIVGLLPTVADALHVTESQTGLLVSAYAIGIAIGSPIFTSLTGSMPRKKLLFMLMVVFILGNAAGSIAPTFGLILISRIITAVAHGVFFSVGTVVAAEMVPANKKGSAVSMMLSGLTIATILGVPFGTVIGQAFGWRWTFIGVALLGIIGFICLLLFLPKNIKMDAPPTFRDQVNLISNGRVILALIMTILGFGGTFVSYTFLAPILQDITGFAESSVSIILLVYGVAVAIGNLIGGRIANQYPIKGLRVVFLLQAVILAVFSLTAPFQALGLVTVFFMGLFAFMMNAGVQVYTVSLADKFVPTARNIASAFTISSFNIGIASGSYIGGIVTDSIGLIHTAWIGALMVVGAIILAFVNYGLDKKQQLFEQ